VSADASALFDAHRFGLVSLVATELAPDGFALLADLRMAKAAPGEDHVLMWSPLFKKMACWIAEWRTGNPSLGLIMTRGISGRLTDESVLRALFKDTMALEEHRRGLFPAVFVWPEHRGRG
jgi:hypothetical protein